MPLRATLEKSGLASQASLAAIVEATADLVSIRMLDFSGVSYMNQAGRRMLGLGPNEAVPDLMDFRTAASRAQWMDVTLPAVLRDGVWSGETIFVDRGGRVIPVSQMTLAHAMPDGQVQLSTIARDITESRRSAADLRASDERLRFAIEAAGMGVWEVDVRTRHVTWTEMKLPGHGDPPRRFAGTAEEFFAGIHPDDRDATRREVDRAIVERVDLTIMFRTLGPSEETSWVEWRGRAIYEPDMTPTQILGVSTDVTKREVLEAQLRQAQKMDAIGQLAGGVAHDFNNLLTAILGYAKFVADGLAPGDRRRSDVEEITKAADRAASLTRQLLAFSRSQVLRSTLVDVNQLVAGVSEMLRRLIGEQITLDVLAAPDLALVLADPGQLEQVVINLAVNARDAMEKGGRLTLETANIELHARSGVHDQIVVPGWYVMLKVADTGLGMDLHTMRHLFEPFFTTKAPGKGTGLGLATVYGIVKQSAGYIWADSEEGHGAAFRVYLPRANRVGVVETAPPLEPEPLARGEELVLLVEDEAGVRRLARRFLENAGYRVLDAASGQDAETIFAEHRADIDLLITDVVMPGMTGPDLFRRLSADEPGLKVIHASGYANGDVASARPQRPGNRTCRRRSRPRCSCHTCAPFSTGGRSVVREGRRPAAGASRRGRRTVPELVRGTAARWSGRRTQNALRASRPSQRRSAIARATGAPTSRIPTGTIHTTPSSAAASASALRHRPVVVMVWRESSEMATFTLCNSEHLFPVIPASLTL
jgi:signal transduction histidine kinase/CheY-like chemotaxis protein